MAVAKAPCVSRKIFPGEGPWQPAPPLRTHPSSLWTETSQDGFPASPAVLATSLCLERAIWDRTDSGSWPRWKEEVTEAILRMAGATPKGQVPPAAGTRPVSTSCPGSSGVALSLSAAIAETQADFKK